MTSTILVLRRGGRNATPSWRSILNGNSVPSSSSCLSGCDLSPPPTMATASFVVRRTMAFVPRRTPPPSVAGVNLRPRSDPLAPPTPHPANGGGGPRPPPVPPPAASVSDGGYRRWTPPSPGANPPAAPTAPKLGGAGMKDGWISPWHKDHYGRIDASTIDHPYLMHGDPHMPVGRFARGDGKVLLDPRGGVARELDDYRQLAADDDDRGDDGDDVDGLEREYGSDAADAIREHLRSFRARMDSASSSSSSSGVGGSADGGGGKVYHSPLDDLEGRFRTIDRLTAAAGSTQDLALRRRARTESRDFFRSGRDVPLPGGGGGGEGGGVGGPSDDDDDDVDLEADGGAGGGAKRGDEREEEEFGRGRKYDAQSVFGKGATVMYPYGKDLPSPTYHPDFPKGSNVGNNPSDIDEEPWMHELNRLIYQERYLEMELGDIDETYTPVNVQKSDMDAYMKERERTKKYNMLQREDEHEMDREEKPDEILEMIKNGEDPNQEAFGPWGECTIKVDRVQKPERGGTTVRYRALVIGGNGNGAAGFGIGKALSPNEAIVKACKHCKRNVFYVDRYLNSGLSYDLAGKHNSCRVRLRAVSPDYGLHGHPLIVEILKYAGVSDATGKSHGNRNPYNVVYATFKALMTHESLEEIAMKRGKKLLNLQRARRLGI